MLLTGSEEAIRLLPRLEDSVDLRTVDDRCDGLFEEVDKELERLRMFREG